MRDVGNTSGKWDLGQSKVGISPATDFSELNDDARCSELGIRFLEKIRVPNNKGNIYTSGICFSSSATENFNYKPRGADLGLDQPGGCNRCSSADFWDASPVTFQDVRCCFQSLEVAAVFHSDWKH